MALFIALLRAINVGGTGKLAMRDLQALCERAGFSKVRTYIQSGNVVFESSLSAARTQATLETALEKKLKKPVRVLLRTVQDLETLIDRNPFPKAAPNRVIVFFLGKTVPKAALRNLEIPGREELAVVGREIFVHYPDGQGRSKLKVPLAGEGTGRNLNTIHKLIAMGRAADR